MASDEQLANALVQITRPGMCGLAWALSILKTCLFWPGKWVRDSLSSGQALTSGCLQNMAADFGKPRSERLANALAQTAQACPGQWGNAYTA